MEFKSLRTRPLKLKYARISRNYTGGLLLVGCRGTIGARKAVMGG